MVDLLPDDAQKLCRVRFGVDLNRVTKNSLTRQEYERLYKFIIPRVGRLLIDYEAGRLDKEIEDLRARQNSVGEANSQPEEKVFRATYQDHIMGSDIPKMERVVASREFSGLTAGYNIVEKKIIALLFGCVDGKCFTAPAIARYFGLESKQILAVKRSALFELKDDFVYNNSRKVLKLK